MLLVSALAAALLNSVRTRVAADELENSSAIATCGKTGKASVKATSSWQYIRSIDASWWMEEDCNLHISIAREIIPSSPPARSKLATMTGLRLMLRIDQLDIQHPTVEADKCTTSSSVCVYSHSLGVWSYPLRDSVVDRYAWFNDSVILWFVARGKFPLSSISATFAALPAINVCEVSWQRAATVVVKNVVYVYAQDNLYVPRLSGSVCNMNRNYTVHARAADASLYVRVTVLASPSVIVANCRRLYVEHRRIVMNLNAPTESFEKVAIVYELLGNCDWALAHVGFTLKLENVPSASSCHTTGFDSLLPIGSPSLQEFISSTSTLTSLLTHAMASSPAASGFSAVGVAVLVATTATVMVIVLIVAVVVVAVRKLRRPVCQQGGAGCESRSASVAGTAAGRRVNDCASASSHCPDELVMVENDLYAAPRISNPA